MSTTEQRFQKRLGPANDNGCIEWTGAKNKDGYGTFWFDKKNSLAHRYALQKKLGRQLESGEHACHTCDNPPCVNEDHLYAGSQADNMRDSVDRKRHKNATLTHCRKNHEFTDDNTYVDSDGKRHCRTCNREAQAAIRKAA